MDYLTGSGMNNLSQQLYNLSQQPYNLSQQPYDLSQQPYDLSQQPYNLSQQPYNLSQQPYNLSQPHTNDRHLWHTQQQDVIVTQEVFQQEFQRSDAYHRITAAMQRWTSQRTVDLRRQSELQWGPIELMSKDYEVSLGRQAEEEGWAKLNDMVAAGYQKYVNRVQEQRRNLPPVEATRLPTEVSSNRSGPIMISDDEEEEQETLQTQPAVIVVENEEEEEQQQQKESEVETPTQTSQQPRRRQLPSWMRTAESLGFSTAMYPERLPHRIAAAGKEEEEQKRQKADRAYKKQLARQWKATRRLERPSEPQLDESAPLPPQGKKAAGGKKRKHKETVPPQEEQEQEVAPERPAKKQRKTKGAVKKPVTPAPAPAPTLAGAIQQESLHQQLQSDGLDDLFEDGEELIPSASLLVREIHPGCLPQQLQNDNLDSLFEHDGLDDLFGDDSPDDLFEDDGLDDLFGDDEDLVPSSPPSAGEMAPRCPPQRTQGDGLDDLFDDNDDDGEELESLLLTAMNGEPETDDYSEEGMKSPSIAEMEMGGLVDNETWSAGEMEAFLAQETDDEDVLATQAPAEHYCDSDSEVSEEE